MADFGFYGDVLGKGIAIAVSPDGTMTASAYAGTNIGISGEAWASRSWNPFTGETGGGTSIYGGVGNPSLLKKGVPFTYQRKITDDGLTNHFLTVGRGIGPLGEAGFYIELTPEEVEYLKSFIPDFGEAPIDVFFNDVLADYIFDAGTWARMNPHLSDYPVDMIQGAGHCFLPSAPVPLADGRTVPISSVREGDEVMAFDPTADGGRGALVPRRVTAVHRSEVDHVLDVFGLGVTPGHATLCGDGPHEGQFRPIMDILLDDGAVVNEDGSLRRLSTNAPVGSEDDLPVRLALVRPHRGPDGKRTMKAVQFGWARTGTRMVKPDGSEFTLGETIRANGWQLVTKGKHKGLIRQKPGTTPKPLPWAGDALPQPEDYVLAKSGKTLDELRSDQSGIEPWNAQLAAV